MQSCLHGIDTFDSCCFGYHICP